MGETVTATLKEKGLSSLHVIVAKLQVPSLAVKGLFWPLFPIFHSIILFYLLLFQMPEAVMGKDLQSPFPGNSKSKKGAKLGAQDLCMGSTGC